MPTDDDRRAAGREVQGQLWPAIRNTQTPPFPAARLAPDFFDYVQQTAFGMIWTRPGLPKRDRSLITCTMLAALGHHEELRAHLAGALNVGLTREDLVEALMRGAVSAGVPDALSSLNVSSW